jgi:drug/metabolite transporter (DMT)-like permease
VLLLSLTPILILALTWCLRDEPVSVIRLAGALVSLVGAGVIVCRGDMAQALATRINAGDGVMAMALPLWAVYSVLLGRRPQSLPTPVLLMGSAVVAVVVLAPFLAWQLPAGPPMHLNAGSLAGILYMGVFASAGAFLCFNHGVGVLGAARAGPYLHLIPVFGTMLAVVLLGEPLHPYHGVGATLVCAGILLAGRRRLPVIHARPHAAGGRPGWTKSTRPPTHPTEVRR